MPNNYDEPGMTSTSLRSRRNILCNRMAMVACGFGRESRLTAARSTGGDGQTQTPRIRLTSCVFLDVNKSSVTVAHGYSM